MFMLCSYFAQNNFKKHKNSEMYIRIRSNDRDTSIIRIVSHNTIECIRVIEFTSATTRYFDTLR